MDTSLDRIRAKIAEFENKIGDLRIAERELLALERTLTRGVKAPPSPKAKRISKATRSAQAPQSIGDAITEVLSRSGVLAFADIVKQLKASGRTIGNRSVSFSLQALRKQGLVKSANGGWALIKARAKSSSEAKPKTKAERKPIASNAAKAG